MKAIPCPISPEELRKLYCEDLLIDSEIASLLGQGATVKRVRAWRHRFGVETLNRTERNIVTPLEGRLRSILIGSMLGDGRLARHPNSAFYVENHADDQKDYLEWKAQEWGIWVTSGIKPVTWKTNGQAFPGWRFNTVGHESLVYWHDLFYPQDGHKIFPESIVDLVDELALTVWYLDDGNAGWWPTITFGLGEASRQVALRILSKFGFTPRWYLHKDPTGQLFIEGEEQAERFIELITPHVPDCMRYKLDFGFQGPHYQLRKRLTEEKLRALVAQGTPIRRIAELTGEASTTIDRFLRRYSIEHPRVVGRPIGS